MHITWHFIHLLGINVSWLLLANGQGWRSGRNVTEVLEAVLVIVKQA
jgi:hypothetical protein